MVDRHPAAEAKAVTARMVSEVVKFLVKMNSQDVLLSADHEPTIQALLRAVKTAR